jgi:predicted amidohydrolase
MLTRISLAQVSSTADLDDNLAVIDAYTARAAAAGARLVVFPEAMMRCFGGNLTDIAQPVDGPWANAVRLIAKRTGVTVVAGMFTPAGEGRVRNTLLVTGGVEANYNKIHLYDAFGYAESDTVAAGDQPLLIDIDGIGVGFTTCYDLRFPGLFQTLAAGGARLIVVSASWGDGPGKLDHWQLLTRARALDSTTFIAACDQARPTIDPAATATKAPLGVGHSQIISPNGQVLAALGADADLLTADIDPDQVDLLRQSLPVLANRKY